MRRALTDSAVECCSPLSPVENFLLRLPFCDTSVHWQLCPKCTRATKLPYVPVLHKGQGSFLPHVPLYLYWSRKLPSPVSLCALAPAPKKCALTKKLPTASERPCVPCPHSPSRTCTGTCRGTGTSTLCYMYRVLYDTTPLRSYAPMLTHIDFAAFPQLLPCLPAPGFPVQGVSPPPQERPRKEGREGECEDENQEQHGCNHSCAVPGPEDLPSTEYCVLARSCLVLTPMGMAVLTQWLIPHSFHFSLGQRW